jgi:hypothetical protein
MASPPKKPPHEFAAVEQDLLLWHVPFDHRELRTFLADVAPLIKTDDAPEVWAPALLEATAHRAGAC